MKEIKLYGYTTSPFVRKTACFLYYKGVDFSHVPVNPVDPNATLAHTNGAQVPVLEIDGEFRRESSHHAVWLDELFPDKPTYPEAHRSKIEHIDAWISDTYLRGIFRYAVEGELNLQQRFVAWRLAALVSAHTPLSEEARHGWPELLRQTPFIQNMVQQLDLSESLLTMHQRIGKEMIGFLGRGPYFGELNHPTMLDLAIFPQLVWGYMFGLQEELTAAKQPTLKAWMQRVAHHLPENPTLDSDKMLINRLAEGLM